MYRRRFRTIPEDEIKKIDKKLGYIGEDEKYTDDYLEQYREKIEEASTEEEKFKMVCALIETKLFTKIKNMKYCELAELYKKEIEELIPGNGIIHKTFRYKGKLLSCFIVPLEEGKSSFYLFDKEKRSFKTITEEEYVYGYSTGRFGKYTSIWTS